MKKIEKSIELGGRTLSLTTGLLAQQASGAVLARYGDTVVLATVVAAPMFQDLGYFPLTVEYQERLYAGGRIKGSRWVKREGRPSDEEILSARLIDRSIRPLFPKNYKKDVQVIITIMSVDGENDPSILAAVAASAAINISPIPWKGPVSTIKIGNKDGELSVNPTTSEMAASNLDLVVSATKDAVVMIEAGAQEVNEKEVLSGIEFAKKNTDKILEFINDFSKEVGVKKEELAKDTDDPELEKQIEKKIAGKIDSVVKQLASSEGGKVGFDEIKSAMIQEFADKDPKLVAASFEKVFTKNIRKMIMGGVRPDGRKHTEIRPISSEVGILPRTHGSAIFQRGQTQVLTTTTLGAPSLGQLIESAEGEESKQYMHHYSMPPYATGETGKFGSPNRREIGHGALAERALIPVIPQKEKFPYAIRLVSEVTSSNGSTSMASVCGSTLSLMDAGVPLKAPVSGIAMGLITEGKDTVILSDIMGIEDFNGDMDFKVAGTQKGITALQMDVKTLTLTLEVLKKALDQAKDGRDHILKEMSKSLSEPREKVSTYAPKIKVVKVPVEKIGEVIGPGGRMIKKIIAESGAQVEVEDDGSVNISGLTDDEMNKAVAMVEALIKEVLKGEIYQGVVKRVQPFGAFVEILPGKEGLVHVSDMAEGFVNDPNEIVKLGDNVQVRVREIDDLGRINLSMRMDPSTDKPKEDRGGSGGGRSFDRRPRFDGGSRGGFQRRPRTEGSGGPHFPTSRYLGESDQKKRFSR